MPPSLMAPGWPGIAPTWTSSAKDMVTSSLGPSRLWATFGHGIVNEIYWPSTGRPQVRDLGFIVADRRGWHEVKRVCRYHFSLPAPYVPLPSFVHDGDGYQLELEIVPDPLRDTLLLSFKLTGDGATLYVLLAPHLGDGGEHNDGYAGDDLSARKGDEALNLLADVGFTRTSAGYVGSSDGWQDFARNGAMTWSYGEAHDGNVALMGEVGASEGVLALGLADTLEGARTLARASLSNGFEAARRRFSAQWESWAKTLKIPDAPAEVRDEAYLSATVLKVHEGRSYPGAVVASLSVPWGNANDSSGGYHLVWARDAVEAGLAMLAVGQVEDARHVLSYAIATQQPDGGWFQNSFPDGRPFWTGVQLDEAAFPILLAAKLEEGGALDGISGSVAMIRRAAAYIAQRGPVTEQDRWEENAGFSPFTLGVEVAALVAGASHLPPQDRAYALSLADYWNERIEDWTYAEGGDFVETRGVDGYYVRIAPPPQKGGLRGRVDVRNRADESLPAAALVGMEYIYLARLGLRDARDPRIQNTLKVTEPVLRVETPHGVAYHRYNFDGYGEHEDGSPFDGTGIGRAWPLLAGERAHLDLLLGIDPLPYLEMMTRMTGPGGLIPEQVWDTAAIPQRFLVPGKPSGSAMPLVWAHAEFLKLLAARQRGRPIEWLTRVEERYRVRRPRAAAWHWREALPFATLPTGRGLLIEAAKPFRLHVGHDGWREIADRPSAPLGLGFHGVMLSADDLARYSALDFTFYFPERDGWGGVDFHIALTP